MRKFGHPFFSTLLGGRMGNLGECHGEKAILVSNPSTRAKSSLMAPYGLNRDQEPLFTPQVVNAEWHETYIDIRVR